MAYGDFKDLSRRTASDEILHDKIFNIVKNAKHDENQRGQMVYKMFDKKTASLAQSHTLLFETLATRPMRDKSAAGGAVKNEIMQNKELPEELHEPVIRKIKKRKVHSSFIDNTCRADLADMQLLSKFDKGIRFYYVLLVFSVNMHGLFL